MPLFKDIAFNEDIPVIHALRRDKVVVIATRVPLKDMLPEHWGWILTLGGKGEIIDASDIEGLQDNAGRRYPKVFLRSDMYGYIERWSCAVWEPGYSDGRGTLLKESGFPDMKQFREELLHEIIIIHHGSKEEQTQALQANLETQVQRLISHEQQTSTASCNAVQNQIATNDSELLRQMLSIQGSNQHHWEDLEGIIVEEVKKGRDGVSGEVESMALEWQSAEQKFDFVIEEIKRSKDEISSEIKDAQQQPQVKQKISEIAEEVKKSRDELSSEFKNIIVEQQRIEQKLDTVATHIQTTILERVESQNAVLERIEQLPHLSEQHLEERPEMLNQKQVVRLDALAMVIQDLQKSISEVKDIFTPLDESEEALSDGTTSSEEIKKLSKNVKTLSDRYMTGIVAMNNRYHATVDQQVKKNSELTSRIINVALVLLVISVISFVVAFFFHLTAIALITNGVVAILSAGATWFGAWSKIQDNAANRQLQALANLSNLVKTAHAQFIIEHIPDEIWQKTQYEHLLRSFITDNTQK